MPRKFKRVIREVDDYPDLLTREEVAVALGVSVYEVRRKERAGILVPSKRVARGQCMFKADDVSFLKKEKDKVALARKSQRVYSPTLYSAEEGKVVFSMLAEQKGLSQIVLETGIHPWKVKVIAEIYQDLTGCMIVTKKSMDTINSLTGLDGNFPITREEELVEVLLACDAKGCSVCGKRAKSICKACSPMVAKKILSDDF